MYICIVAFCQILYISSCIWIFVFVTNWVIFCFCLLSRNPNSCKPKGMSREGTNRSPSAMSNASNSGVQVRLRQPGLHRKPRPTSIAVSGMSQSMYEKKTTSAASTPSSFRGPPRCEIDTNMYLYMRERGGVILG